MKNSLKGFIGRFKHADERISELENKTMEYIKPEEQKGKRLKEKEQTLRDLCNTIR